MLIIYYILLAIPLLLTIFNLLLLRSHTGGDKSTRFDRLARPLTARLIAWRQGYSYGYVRETFRIRDHAELHHDQDVEVVRAMHRLSERYPEDYRKAMRKARSNQ